MQPPVTAAIVIATATLVAAVLGGMVKERVLPTLNKRISLHVELIQHHQPS